MDLDFRARSSLKVELLDPTTGLPGSESIGFNFGGSGTVPAAGVACISWVPTTGKVLTVDLSGGLDVTSDGSAPVIEQLITSVSGDVLYVAAADRFEIVLVPDPLALDSYGNPISASRASEMTITATGSDDVVHSVSTIAVTTVGKPAICRRVSRVNGAAVLSGLSISAVTATPCKLYILFGGIVAA